MTAVKFLQEKIKIYLPSIHQKGLEDAINKANKMFEQQIIDAHDMGYIDGGNHKKVTAEQYYNETYGSKGSGMSEKPTFSQTEISDEEIKKIPLEDALKFTEWMSSLINSNYKSGGNWYHKGEIVTTKKLYEKWYREQLKKKQ